MFAHLWRHLPVILLPVLATTAQHTIAHYHSARLYRLLLHTKSRRLSQQPISAPVQGTRSAQKFASSLLRQCVMGSRMVSPIFTVLVVHAPMTTQHNGSVAQCQTAQSVAVVVEACRCGQPPATHRFRAIIPQSARRAVSVQHSLYCPHPPRQQAKVYNDRCVVMTAGTA